MKNVLSFILITLIIPQLNAQNCNAFKYYGDTLQYEACMIAEEAENYYQFSKEYQEIYDRSIEKCPYFSTAYHAKSVAYLKSGDFITWKALIDKAVELKPKEYLGYRGWCRYQFFKDYEGAIRDIERLDSLIDYDLGHSSNGDYHLNIVKGICYKAIGENEKAIRIIEEQLNDEEHSVGIYDYLHLGAWYLEIGKVQKSIEFLEMQEEQNDIAENRYYKALAYKTLGQMDKYVTNLKLSQEMYRRGSRMNDPYNPPYDKVYLKQIENEMNTVANNG